jgi:hypothetical protein
MYASLIIDEFNAISEQMNSFNVTNASTSDGGKESKTDRNLFHKQGFGDELIQIETKQPGCLHRLYEIIPMTFIM